MERLRRRQRSICILAVLLIIVQLFADQVSLAIDWQHVKPMYLVAMQMETLDKIDDVSPQTMDEAEVIFNLETDPMLEEALPGGTMAMDRIFGGNVARSFCFPYQVGLLLQRPRGLYWCGGSLISDEYVLTAAHCVDMAKRALVFLGAHEIKNAKETGQVRIMVNHSSFVIFPTWNSKRLRDDIALVRLPVPIEFNERIHPIALPRRSYEYRNFQNKLAIASGWGRYATGVHAISGVLRFVKLRLVDGRTCKRSFPFSYRSTNICTSGKYEKSTCNGDSGGPLVLQRKLSKRRVLVGITSFGSIFGCDQGYPAAFTKVAAYLDWISDETGVEPQQDSTDAELFRSELDEWEPSYNYMQCELSSIDESEETEPIDTEPTTPQMLHEHIQRYPDGTLLRTSFYNG